jgi:hypothetical protein
VEAARATLTLGRAARRRRAKRRERSESQAEEAT